jgi:hypothetical protein
VWETSYTAEEYIAFLNTFSGHISVDPPKREHLYREIRRRIGERADHRMRRHWYAMLHVARAIAQAPYMRRWTALYSSAGGVDAE